MCIGAINKFKKDTSDDVLGNVAKSEKAFRKFCKALPKGGKENRFVSLKISCLKQSHYKLKQWIIN